MGTDETGTSRAGRAADETPSRELVTEFHARGVPIGAPDDARDGIHVVATVRERDEADEERSTATPLLGLRRTPGQAPPLESVPGMVDAFTNWVLAQAPRRQPAIFQATGLALLGALTGRQFQTQSGLRGNVFFLVIAGTGMGKDVAISATRRLAQAADCSRYIGGHPGSFRGFHRFLVEHPARFFPIDEMGKLMLAANGQPAGPQRQMLDFLLQLYSSSVAAGELPAHLIAKASESTPAVPQACTSLVGFSTEEAWNALTPSASSDGWLPRFLLVEGDPDAPLGRGSFVPPPDSLVAAVRRIVKDLPGHNYGAGADRMSSDVVPQVFTLGEDSAIAEIDEHLRSASDEWARDARQADRPWIAELVSRWRENGIKLAMLRATSRWSMEPTADRPLLCAADYLWGLSYAEDSIRRMARALADRVGANEHDLLVKRVRRAIAAGAGPDGWVLQSVLRRRFGGRVSTREFKDAVETLDDMGDVEHAREPAQGRTGAGRPSDRYQLTPSGQRRLDC